MDHYVTAAAMHGEWSFIACRCRWAGFTTDPMKKWYEHLADIDKAEKEWLSK